MAAGLVLEQPIDCRMGETCFIQQYADHDPGPNAKDYRCGPLTYDGHDGTDFRVPSLEAQRAGVRVLAAADGTVKAVRDGMDDVSVATIGEAAVKGKECGNGVVIDHPGGWVTQYCHMARGSLRVRPGQTVKTGEPLGLVGESGDAAFPHLHLSVRLGQEKVDPFAYGGPQGQCGSGRPLWSSRAQAALAYRSPELINWGFSAFAPAMEDIDTGRAQTGPPTADSPALVAFARLIGLHRGDELHLQIDGPAGFAVRSDPPAIDHDKAQYMLFAGKKLTASAWPAGAYRAHLTVTRAGKPVLDRSFERTVR